MTSWTLGTKRRQEKKEPEEDYSKKYIQVNTCCECEIYLFVRQTYNFQYTINPLTKKICDLHKESAIGKYGDYIRGHLI